MPFSVAPMPCSRTPNQMLRLAYSPGWKLSSPLVGISFDDARSAEPPINQGTLDLIASSALPEAWRVASSPSAGVNVGRSASQPGGSSPANACLSCWPSLGYAVRSEEHTSEL